MANWHGMGLYGLGSRYPFLKSLGMRGVGLGVVMGCVGRGTREE